MGGLKQAGKQQSAVSQELFEYLNSLLQQAEAESGTPELELRSKIEALATETRTVPTPPTHAMSEVELLGKLDELSAKVESVSKLLKEVESDTDAQNFLSSSSDLWMPVITATAEERLATSSTHSNPSNKDGTNPSDNQ